jgi:hypothetical protein
MPANVAITQDTANPYSEADIRINPNNLLQIIAASNANNGASQAQYWSSDGGVTWNQASLPTVSGDNFQGDPAVDWTSDGTAWALANGVAIMTAKVVVRGFKSTDGGKTWTNDSVLSGTQTATDKPSLWVDRSTSSPFHDNMYAVWHLGAACWVASRKGPGGTWQAPIQVSGSETTLTADGGDIKTNAFGDVFVFWPDAGGQTLRVAKSTDGGATFSALPGSPVKIASTFGQFTIKIPAQNTRTTATGTIGCLIYITGGAFRTATQDLVFACWHDLTGGTGCNSEANQPGGTVTSTCKTRIWFARSIDGGKTWGSAQKLNDQSSLNDQFFPRLAVDDLTGNLMVVYYDTVNDPNRVKTDIWMQNSSDGGATWSPAVQVTTAQTDESTGSKDNSQQYGDYIGLSGYGGRFFACWTDRRGGGDEQIWGAPLAIPSLGFRVDKDTFGQDEVAAKASYPSAYWLAVDGFTNESLGFNSSSDLNSTPNPQPTVTATVDPTLNPTLTAGQIATVAANLPTVNTLGPLPILATDPTLGLEMQTFLYPYTISFANSNAFNALSAHQIVLVTLSASLTVGPVTVKAQATIELAKGEDPFFTDVNPADPTTFPAWLSFDLRFFKVTPSQSHQMFSVPNPTDASGAVPYIQNVLKNLNNSSLITNGDTFDGTLSQDEEQSALEFLPTDKDGNPTFNFAVARVRIVAASQTTVGPVRVFFRLFQAASTASNFSEVGTGEGTYRWGTDGSANHKIPLLGVEKDQSGNLEYVTVPCFAAPRVNQTSPADMKTQHDDTNAVQITTVAGGEVDTFFGCWLDVNQTGQAADNFLIPTPPASQSQWDGPWTGTQTLSGAIAVSPHQCLIAEIRFDDTPIPPGATYSTSDKLAQRNIAWIDGPNPGTDASRVMPHPFEIRASFSADTPDELMITWGATPSGTTASLYFPAVPASAILKLANATYPAHRLTELDGNTIQCPAEGVTLVPIPQGKGRYAGLLSLDLPLGIGRGAIYEVVVRQLTQATPQVVSPPPGPRITVPAAGIPAATTPDGPISWRQALGAFQYTIVVSTKDQLLVPEERLLAWLKWRVSVTPPGSRWRPILSRYLDQVSGRVSGFGGNPGAIQPSPTGGPIPTRVKVAITFPPNFNTFLVGKPIEVRGNATWTPAGPSPIQSMQLSAFESRFDGVTFGQWVHVNDFPLTLTPEPGNTVIWVHEVIPFDGMVRYLLTAFAFGFDGELIGSSDPLFLKSVS